MASLPEIIDKVTGYHPGADVNLIQRAYEFAEKQHDGQVRKSGDPYFVHPVNVANIIADMRLDAKSVCAALLHDVVEDCDVESEELAELFGEEVAFLVDGVTKLGKVNFASKEDRQAESFRKMIVAMARDIRVLLVKLADRLDNMRSLEFMSPRSQERIARESLEIYAPLAGRLGIHWMLAELEDLSFKYLYPAEYEKLAEQVEKAGREADKYVQETCKRIRKLLLARGFAAEVSGRKKHLYSNYKKMKRTQREFEQIHDFIAFRILTENVSDCYAVLGVVHSEWTPIPGRFKDYVALPKPNMYQSLHTTVIGPENRRIEVQIRTFEMHRTAENGIAAHWQYKSGSGGIDPKDAARFAWLRQLMEFQKEFHDPEEFYASVKDDLFPEEIFVFTPKGEVRTFPRNATPIDFAYAIHSEVGEHCAGAKVNGALVPLRYKMRNGDVVEIITKPNQHPSKDWLDFVVTGRARSRIRSYLRQRGRQQSVKLGRDLLEREFRKHDLSFSRFLKSPELPKMIEAMHVAQLEDLFAQIGYGKVNASEVIAVIAPPSDQQPDSLRPSFIERTVRKVRPKDEGGVLIEGMEDILIRFAKCCTPVVGDPITGWITRGRGVTIHRRGCDRAMELDPDRRVEVSWAPHSKVDLPVVLRVVTDDRPGVLSAITRVLSDNGLNITEATCRTEDAGRAVNVLRIRVSDLDDLRTAIRGVAKIPGVGDVARI